VGVGAVQPFFAGSQKFDAPSRPGAYGTEADINRPMAPAQSVGNHREWTYDEFTGEGIVPMDPC
jgi:hypothetical protein